MYWPTDDDRLCVLMIMKIVNRNDEYKIYTGWAIRRKNFKNLIVARPMKIFHSNKFYFIWKSMRFYETNFSNFFLL